ncbi:MAG: ATP-dependent Clp protease ATP-binding subunit, partial [Lactovum sp.]
LIFQQIVNENKLRIPKLKPKENKAVVPMAQRRKNKKKDKQSKTPTLDSVSADLIQEALEGKYDPTIGREKEIDRLLHILSRRGKNNPVLVGEPGVGKTAIIEGLAHRVIEGKVPKQLENVRLISLSMASVIAGTSLRGEFEDRMVSIIEEVSKDPDTILFIDEIHTIIGAGGGKDSVNDASNILKPALARGDFQLIGATTHKEYQMYVEKDEALDRRLSKVIVNEVNQEEAIEILRGICPKYEEFHNVRISEEALEKIVELSVRYLPSRRLPDKAIDLLDEAAAKLKISNNKRTSRPLENKLKSLKEELPDVLASLDIKKIKSLNKEIERLEDKLEKLKESKADLSELKEEDVYSVVSELTSIPVQQMTKSESERLLSLEKELHKRVVGQEEAIEAISKAIRRSRSGVSSGKRPMGSFMFLGPTGVGKTELAKALAETVFGSENNMIRVDMSEFMEKFSASRLIGSPPGYVGYEEGGQLTEQVRNQPYSVILFDEAEKAHPDIFNLLLQILDDGFITDTKGRKIDFRHAIIIMTSNLGATALRDDKVVGFTAKDWSEDYKATKQRILEEVKEHYRPEFINRIDEIIVFHSLEEAEVQEIVKLLINSLCQHLRKEAISLKVNPSAVKYLSKVGYDKEYGARPLRKLIEREIEDKLSELILSSKLKANQQVKVSVNKEKLKFIVLESK